MLRILIPSLMCLVVSINLVEAKTTVTSQPFGKLPDGTAVESSWATNWTGYKSSPEALRAGIIRLTDLTRQVVFLFEVAVH